MPLAAQRVWQREYIWAAAIFAAAAVTDALDGWLARRLNARSNLGMILDPLADKALITAIFLTLAVDRVLPAWFVALVVGRDVWILAMAGLGFLLTTHRAFPPSLWGKLSTIAQMVYLLLMLLNRGGLDAQGWEVGAERVLYWLVAALAAVSGLHYTWIAWRLFRDSRSPAAANRAGWRP